MSEEANNTAPVESTTPEIAPNVLPPEPAEPTEEPVMIAENIDEMSQEQLTAIVPEKVETSPPEQKPETPEPAAVATDPVIDAPIAPDLGNPEMENKESSVPTFQQMPEEETIVAVETPSVTNPAPTNEQIAVTLPEPSNEDTYQAKSASDQVPTFQQMPEAPTTLVDEASASDNMPIDSEDEEEEQPKKGFNKKIPLIIIGITLVAVIAVGIMVMRTKGNGGTVKTLRPNRSVTSSTNIAVLGHVDTPRSELVVAMSKFMSIDITKDEVESCKEEEKHSMTYGVHHIDLNIDGTNYSINYLCGFSSAIKYLIVSEANNTVDGAVSVVSAKEGIMPQTRELVLTLSKLGINKIVVYVIADGDTATVTEDIKKLLEQYNIDNKNTPIVVGNISDEKTIQELITDIGNWIQKETNYNGPSAVQNHKTLKLYTTFKTAEEDGMQDNLTKKNKNKLTFTINNKDYSGKVKFEEGVELIKPGDNQEITITLNENIPIIKGMRVLVSQNDKVIGVGVISEVE